MTKPDPISIAKAELADAKAQRDLAQQNFNAAQAQIQQGQQKAAEAQQMVLIASGAVQQCEAFLKKLEPEEEEAALAAVPTPTNIQPNIQKCACGAYKGRSEGQLPSGHGFAECPAVTGS